MKLVIVESPNKVKTISKYLGHDYRVMASAGHIRDLAMSGKDNLGVDVENNFEPDYVVSTRSRSTISKLKQASRAAETVYLATDPDREGEAISWHLAQVLDLDVASTPRLEFHEITNYGIKDALAAPRVIDMNLVHSQEARRIIDRLMGFELSGLLQKKIHSVSAGRVQSAVLKIICDREDEIDAFVPQEYWEIFAEVIDRDIIHKAKLTKLNGEDIKVANQTEAEQLIKALGQSLQVSAIKEEEKDYYPAPPFIASTLQQEAFYTYHFSNKQTMDIAQSLFEGGYITYHRTDSYRLSPVFINAAKEEIRNAYGPEYVGTAYSGKNGDGKVQGGHEGIRPTNLKLYPKVAADTVFTGAKQKGMAQLYELIYKRAVASMMKPRHQINTTVTLSKNGYDFTLEGSQVTFLGYQSVYNPRKLEPAHFEYHFKEGQDLPIKEISKEQKFTKAPSRYNEASIVKTMEELGIGRPSTYVSTIENLKSITRHYIEIMKGQIKPTKRGRMTSKYLAEYFASLVDSKYTASLEVELDKVALGEEKEVGLIREFYDNFTVTLKYAEENMGEEKEQLLAEKCPVCGSPLVVRYNKKGKFTGCSNYPACHYIKREVDPEDQKPVEGEGKVCPKCGKGHLVKRKSRFGYFLACDRYPECKYIERIARKGKGKGKYFKSRKKKAAE